MPPATDNPYPSDPVATSTKGSLGVGWPSNSESNYLNLSNSAGSIKPAMDHAAYKIGAA